MFRSRFGILQVSSGTLSNVRDWCYLSADLLHGTVWLLKLHKSRVHSRLEEGQKNPLRIEKSHLVTSLIPWPSFGGKRTWAV